MTISNEPISPGSPVKFKVTGFPEESAVKSAIERFYKLKPDAEHAFQVNNSFDELIMAGHVDAEGKIDQFAHNEHHDKRFLADKLNDKEDRV